MPSHSIVANHQSPAQSRARWEDCSRRQGRAACLATRRNPREHPHANRCPPSMKPLVPRTSRCLFQRPRLALHRLPRLPRRHIFLRLRRRRRTSVREPSRLIRTEARAYRILSRKHEVHSWARRLPPALLHHPLWPPRNRWHGQACLSIVPHSRLPSRVRSSPLSIPSVRRSLLPPDLGGRITSTLAIHCNRRRPTKRLPLILPDR